MLASFAPTRAAERVATADPTAGASCALRTWLLGDNWRRLWSTPVTLPVLDLDRFAGGLRPVDAVGALQTRSLALAAADGRSFTFRSLAKRVDAALPALLRWGPQAALLRDQVSAILPAADLLAARLSRRLGLLVTQRRLVILPDAPALGAYRDDFGGRVGALSEYPRAGPGGTPGTFGATELVDTAELWRRSRRPEARPVDARAYLRARLVDWWIGDWDRHPGQWRWAGIPGSDGWQPLPEDHDHAFSHYDGVLAAALRPLVPWLGPFDASFSTRALMGSSRWLDAWLLAGLDRRAWLEEAAALEARATRERIDEALAGFPPAWQRVSGERLRAVLLARRAVLRERALDIFAALSRVVRVYGSDADDRARLHCAGDGSLALSLSGPGGRERLRRTLHPDETERLELYLLGGDDRVVRTGVLPCAIEVRDHRASALELELGVPAPRPHEHGPRRRRGPL